MQAGQPVFLPLKRFEHGLVRETDREFEILLVACDLGNVGQHFVHAAVFAAQHGLHLLRRQVRAQAQRPVRQRDQHVARPGVAGMAPGIAQTGKQLVQVVPRHPLAVDGETVGLQLAVRDVVEGGAAAGNAAEITVAVALLGTLQFGDEVVQSIQDFAVAGRGIHERQRRQVMPAHVAVEAGRFPVAVAILFRRQARFAQERRQQAVRIKFQQVVQIGLLRFEERAGCEAHVRQREQLHGCRRVGGGECQSAGDKAKKARRKFHGIK